MHRNTASNFKTEKYAGDPEKLAAIRRALEAAGVEFINGEEPGVKLRGRRKPTKKPATKSTEEDLASERDKQRDIAAGRRKPP